MPTHPNAKNPHNPYAAAVNKISKSELVRILLDMLMPEGLGSCEDENPEYAVAQSAVFQYLLVESPNVPALAAVSADRAAVSSQGTTLYGYQIPLSALEDLFDTGTFTAGVNFSSPPAFVSEGLVAAQYLALQAGSEQAEDEAWLTDLPSGPMPALGHARTRCLDTTLTVDSALGGEQSDDLQTLGTSLTLFSPL